MRGKVHGHLATEHKQTEAGRLNLGSAVFERAENQQGTQMEAGPTIFQLRVGEGQGKNVQRPKCLRPGSVAR